MVRDGTPARILKTISPAGRLLNLAAAEAFEYGVTDGIVESREELLGALGATGAEVSEISISWSESFFGALGAYAWILWAIAIGLLYLEAKTPGFGLMGSLGIGLVALLLFRNHMIGLAELPEILLVVLGVVLLAIEVFVIPGFGVTGIVGIVAIALGVVLSFLPFFMPSSAAESDLLHLSIRNFVLSILLGPLGAYLAFHFVLRKTPLYRSLATLGPVADEVAGSAAALTPDHSSAGVRTGDRGAAVSVLRPAGKVEIDGKLLDAVTGGEYIEQGSRIEVVAIAANHVVVRAALAET
jgi:membrane-bound serine protease (ClpP class)